jgi:hypothetical protein
LVIELFGRLIEFHEHCFSARARILVAHSGAVAIGGRRLERGNPYSAIAPKQFGADRAPPLELTTKQADTLVDKPPPPRTVAFERFAAFGAQSSSAIHTAASRQSSQLFDSINNSAGDDNTANSLSSR